MIDPQAAHPDCMAGERADQIADPPDLRGCRGRPVLESAVRAFWLAALSGHALIAGAIA